MTERMTVFLGWLCICGQDNRNNKTCSKCGIDMDSPIRHDTFIEWREIIRAEERDRIVQALEADHSKDTTQPHPHGPCYINMDRVIAIVRGEV
jgi:hypothetical protein